MNNDDTQRLSGCRFTLPDKPSPLLSLLQSQPAALPQGRPAERELKIQQNTVNLLLWLQNPKLTQLDRLRRLQEALDTAADSNLAFDD